LVSKDKNGIGSNQGEKTIDEERLPERQTQQNFMIFLIRFQIKQNIFFIHIRLTGKQQKDYAMREIRIR
jgi:hypothetical protein